MTARTRIASLAVALTAVAAGSTLSAQAPASREIRGTVYDSLAKAPLAHASVSILDKSDPSVAARTVATDAAGRFDFTDVPPGVYLIGFQAPLLDSLGVRSPTRVVQLGADRRGAVIVNLAVPSAATVHDAFCPNRARDDSTSLFIGHLGNATTRGVVPNGEVDATWVEIIGKGKKASIEPRSARVHSGADGWFALCDLPASAMVAVHAAAGADTSSMIYFVTPATRGIMRHELYLADRNAPRTGVITGRIADADRKQPLGGAQVISEASGATATSSDSGKFTLTGLPYGSSDLVVRRIGYLPQRAVVDVLAGEPTSVNLSLLTRGNVLDTVRVRASRTIADDNGFSQRRKAGWGRFYDRAELDRMQPFETVDIVRRAPGVRIKTSGFDSKIMTFNAMSGQFNCPPSFWLDGRQVRWIETTRDLEFVAPPEELAAIEVYSDGIDVPPEFQTGMLSTCGAIVMWTLPVQLWNQHRDGGN